MRFFLYILNLLQSALTSRHAPARLAATLAMTGLSQATFAQVGGLSKAKTTLEALRDQLDIILPIAAVIIGVIIAVLYSAEIMRKDDAVRWGIGVVVAGSVGELVVLLWK
ncbi:TrbC/VirB2 family protein [Castellaniella denitrificans]|uniref:TrbC/VirB2 family protein n=1 Tax=Castellaniella denitrificans TaxID=56119 RepID=A0ABT4M087_9BURK|nr:TrbC/VirB2 family protein [Castellaniella denitrificans]MCZ4328484.1 TrbC/VirB2 family protein [Castellaniella denitrificans]